MTGYLLPAGKMWQDRLQNSLAAFKQSLGGRQASSTAANVLQLLEVAMGNAQDFGDETSSKDFSHNASRRLRPQRGIPPGGFFAAGAGLRF
jgi:hypothetical protein